MSKLTDEQAAKYKRMLDYEREQAKKEGVSFDKYQAKKMKEAEEQAIRNGWYDPRTESEKLEDKKEGILTTILMILAVIGGVVIIIAFL